MEIEFLNHASVKLHTADATILTDPWFSGRAFNNGWRLISEQPAQASAALLDTTHIWLSHEHPDHFQPAFFLGIPEAIRKNFTILFQRTKDYRVANFLRDQKFHVEEVATGMKMSVGRETVLYVNSHGYYDSYLHVEDSSGSVLNLNDCQFHGRKGLKAIRKRYGSPTVLLTQFSYAAWKGGRDNRTWRIKASEEKLDHVTAQAEELQVKYLIPFASFIYFCHDENEYLNDSVNTVEDVIEISERYQAKTIVLAPNERWTVGQNHDNKSALAFWRTEYAGLKGLPRDKASTSCSLDDLKEAFEAYRRNVFQKNSRTLIWLLQAIPFLSLLKQLTVKLSDLECVVEVDLSRGLAKDQGTLFDVEMHSSSLMLIFNYETGFDTLTVNGRFEASYEGFSKMTRLFAIGSLNALGLTLGFGIIVRLGLLLTLLHQLIRAKRHMG